jgi:cation diffusion facilitator family transporter
MTMPSRSSKKVVYVAIIANLAIAACKYLAAAATGSSAMLAEAFHSTADCGNELLLVIGMKRSARPADLLHPYGHGKVLYFYSLLVAVYIFAIGGTLAFYQGITHILHPATSTNVGWNYAVLALAAAFDLYSWRVSYRELLAHKEPRESMWDEIIGSKNPIIFTVFLEDSAGLIGGALAFFGILLGHLFHNPYFDPAASILIAVLLTLVAFFLGRESGALLVGERTNRARIRRIRQILESDASVQQVGKILTMQLGPDEVLLTVDVRFARNLGVRDLEGTIDRLEENIRREEPMIKRIFLEADSLRPAKPRRKAG